EVGDLGEAVLHELRRARARLENEDALVVLRPVEVLAVALEVARRLRKVGDLCLLTVADLHLYELLWVIAQVLLCDDVDCIVGERLLIDDVAPITDANLADLVHALTGQASDADFAFGQNDDELVARDLEAGDAATDVGIAFRELKDVVAVARRVDADRADPTA